MTAAAGSEARRNRSLRRIDWRFLLPNPSPARVLCLGDGFLGRSAKALSEYVVGRDGQSLWFHSIGQKLAIHFSCFKHLRKKKHRRSVSMK